MNSSTKARSLNGFPRVRKRNSVGNKASSRTAQNAVQRCTSLLRNNKSLAGTLQETRCELSTYKSYFEDSLEYMSKIKLARSKMVQLSTSLKNFIQAFDETLLLMDIDDSKFPNFTTSKSNRNIPKGMNTVLEATDEGEGAVLVGQEIGCHEGNNLKGDEVFEKSSSPSRALQNSVNDEESNAIVPKVPNKSPQKKTQDSAPKFSTSQTECAEAMDDTRKEIHNFSPKKYPDSSSLHSSTSSQSVKKTKIPRCQGLAANLKKQNFPKESELQNCKRKSPEKMCEKSDFESRKRKTFVIKSNNTLTDSESTKNQTDLEAIANASEDAVISIMDKRKTYFKKITDVPDEHDELSMPKDLFVYEKDKRKTFVKKAIDISNESEETVNNLFAVEKDKRKTRVIKNSTIFKETEHFTSSNKMEDNKVAENRVILSEPSDANDVFVSKNNRKTFVKKNSDKIVSPLNNMPECPYPSPVKACTPVKSKFTSFITEQNKNIGAENLEVPSELECNVKTDILAVKTNSITPETIEPILRVTELDEDKEMFSNEVARDDNISSAVHSNVDDKREEMSENLNSKTDSTSSDHIVTDIPMHDIDELNRGMIVVSDALPKEACNHSPIRTRRSFLEMSQSDDEVLFVEEIDFVEKRPAFQTTPVRGQILKNKKRKFKFDANKRKSILKKSSSNETNASINKSDGNATKDKSVHFTSDDLVNNGIAANVQSDTCRTTGKKTKKTSNKKMKEDQEACGKNNAVKASNKLHKVKDNKGNCSKDAEVDDLIRMAKKPKKKRVKKIKKEGAYFDDDGISKFKEGKKVIPQIDDETVDKTDKDPETDFPCKKTGKNTFLVHAEIHAPPPSTKVPEIEKMDDEIAKLKLKNMKVAVVLDDVMKSKDIKLLSGYDRDFLCGKTAPETFSESASNAFVDPDESIERFRCDPVPDADDICLDALLDTNNCDLQSDEGIDSENTRARRRKAVSYKEPNLNRKMRRC